MMEKEETIVEASKYFAMLSEYRSAKEYAAKGNVDRAMVSAVKSSVLYNSLKKAGFIDNLPEEDLLCFKGICDDFVQAIAAEAYLAASETALKEGNIKKSQSNYWLIMPGTELRQYLDSENGELAKRAKRLDNLLQFVNQKYFN
ncbi:MAG: hypothetical protein QW666_01155 [Candidatus Woesearchaeota archaeon]